MDIVNIIQKGFEKWYNNKYNTKVSIVINYSDIQKLAIKAYHTVCIEVCAVAIIKGEQCVRQLFRIEENYNHGITGEESAKEGMLIKALAKMLEIADNSKDRF